MRSTIVSGLLAGALALSGCASLQQSARDAGVPEAVVQGGTVIAQTARQRVTEKELERA